MATAIQVYLHGGGSGLLALWTALGSGGVAGAAALLGAWFADRRRIDLDRRRLLSEKLQETMATILHWANFVGDEADARERSLNGGPTYQPQAPPMDLQMVDALATMYFPKDLSDLLLKATAATRAHHHALDILEAVPTGQDHRPQRAAAATTGKAFGAALDALRNKIRAENGLPPVNR